MSQLATVIFSFLLALNVANALITPEEAKNLVMLQSDISSEKRNFDSEINEQSLVEFMNTYNTNSADQGHIRPVLLKFHRIVDSLQATKKFYQKFKTFSDALRDIKEYLNLDDVDAYAQEIYKAVNNEEKEKVAVLDVLAHNQDPESKCVTNASSVDLITKLYESVAYAQVEALTVPLYTYNLLEIIKEESHNMELYKLFVRFMEKMSNTLSNVNKAIETASKEIKKCNN